MQKPMANLWDKAARNAIVVTRFKPVPLLTTPLVVLSLVPGPLESYAVVRVA